MLILVSFYFISCVTVIGASMVIFSRNPVHSVLWLIFVFLNSATLFVFLGAEFLAMILIIVYVGAVVVLFMFVVMMLNVDLSAVREGLLNYLPVGGLIGLVLLFEFLFVAVSFKGKNVSSSSGENDLNSVTSSNTELLGNVLYTEYFYLFQLSGLILLVAMIGAISLTLRERKGIRRQDPEQQSARSKADSIEIKKVDFDSGVL